MGLIMNLRSLVDQTTKAYTEKYAEQAVKIYKSSKGKQQIELELIQLSYKFLEDCMIVVLDYINDEYGIKTKRLTEKELEKLFYTKDGKSLDDRISEYVKQDQVTFTYSIYRLFRTEAVVTTNNILFHKLKSHFDYIMIENVYCCELCMDLNPRFSGWTPIEEIDENDLPPYHPECKCVFKFAKKEDIQ